MRITNKLEVNVWIIVSAIILMFALFVFVGRGKTQQNLVLAYSTELKAERLKPLPTPSPTPQGVDLTEYAKMQQIVKDVFGKYADTAFKLLSCENGKLDPGATNQNYDANHTKDWGLFQINDYWQGVRHEGKARQLLLDPQINARVAWRLFEDSGYRFSLWTCGKELGIRSLWNH